MIRSALLVATALWTALPALASPELARSRICMGCHAVERKLVGPSFKDIAARYASQPDAVARMADKIVKGGSGAWGPVPMPANPKVTADEARQLAAWVMSLK
ncbi:MAG: c-type cytochrome [Rubrivivax sp.]|nr:c-type cytochrome [Rubrivivax sp.]